MTRNTPQRPDHDPAPRPDKPVAAGDAPTTVQGTLNRLFVGRSGSGKTGYRWWLWVFLGEDTVAFRLDPTRSHDVPEGHFPADADVVLWSGDPLDLQSRVLRTWVDGVEVYTYDEEAGAGTVRPR